MPGIGHELPDDIVAHAGDTLRALTDPGGRAEGYLDYSGRGVQRARGSLRMAPTRFGSPLSALAMAA